MKLNRVHFVIVSVQKCSHIQMTHGFLCNALTVMLMGQKTMIMIRRFRHGTRERRILHPRANDSGVAGAILSPA